MSKLISMESRSILGQGWGWGGVCIYYTYVKSSKEIFVNNIQYSRVILEVLRWKADMMKTKTMFSEIVSTEAGDIESKKSN